MFQTFAKCINYKQQSMQVWLLCIRYGSLFMYAICYNLLKWICVFHRTLWVGWLFELIVILLQTETIDLSEQSGKSDRAQRMFRRSNTDKSVHPWIDSDGLPYVGQVNNLIHVVITLFIHMNPFFLEIDNLFDISLLDDTSKRALLQYI